MWPKSGTVFAVRPKSGTILLCSQKQVKDKLSTYHGRAGWWCTHRFFFFLARGIRGYFCVGQSEASVPSVQVHKAVHFCMCFLAPTRFLGHNPTGAHPFFAFAPQKQCLEHKNKQQNKKALKTKWKVKKYIYIDTSVYI